MILVHGVLGITIPSHGVLEIIVHANLRVPTCKLFTRCMANALEVVYMKMFKGNIRYICRSTLVASRKSSLARGTDAGAMHPNLLSGSQRYLQSSRLPRDYLMDRQIQVWEIISSSLRIYIVVFLTCRRHYRRRLPTLNGEISLICMVSSITLDCAHLPTIHVFHIQSNPKRHPTFPLIAASWPTFIHHSRRCRSGPSTLIPLFLGAPQAHHCSCSDILRSPRVCPKRPISAVVGCPERQLARITAASTSLCRDTPQSHPWLTSDCTV
jgi:hypothetical protein